MELEYETLAPQEIPIKVAGVVQYVLRTPSLGAGAAYEDARLSGGLMRKIDGRDDYLIERSTMHRAEAVLLAGCLFKANGDGKFSVPLSVVEVEALPDFVRDELVEQAQKLRQKPSKN